MKRLPFKQFSPVILLWLQRTTFKLTHWPEQQCSPTPLATQKDWWNWQLEGCQSTSLSRPCYCTLMLPGHPLVQCMASVYECETLCMCVCVNRCQPGWVKSGGQILCVCMTINLILILLTYGRQHLFVALVWTWCIYICTTYPWDVVSLGSNIES